MLTCMHTGLLLPPSNIQIDYQPYSLQIVISWQQPFTLNITHQGQEDIIVYNIFVCTYFESPESFGDCEVYNTSNTWYTYNYSSVVTQPDLVCNKSVLPFFQLSSINRVGESARSEPLCLRNVLCTSTPGIKHCRSCNYVHILTIYSGNLLRGPIFSIRT